MAVWRYLLLLVWTGRVLAETSNPNDEFMALRKVNGSNEKSPQELSYHLKSAPTVQSTNADENKIRNSSLQRAFFAKNLPVRKILPKGFLTDWSPVIRIENITQNNSMPKRFLNLRPRARRRKLMKIRRPNNKKNVGQYEQETARKPKTFSTDSFRAFELHLNHNGETDKGVKTSDHRNNSHVFQNSPKSDILRQSLRDEISPLQISPLTMRNPFQLKEEENKKHSYLLNSSRTHGYSTGMETAPLTMKNFDFQHYNPSNHRAHIIARPKLHLTNLKHTFKDFSNNKITMLPIERKGEASKEYPMSSNETSFGNKIQAITQELDIPSIQSDIYANSFEKDGQDFLTMWHKKFGSSAAYKPQVIDVSSEMLVNDNEQFSPLNSAEDQIQSIQLLEDNQEKLPPEFELFSSVEHFVHPSVLLTNPPDDYVDNPPNIIYQYSQPPEVSYTGQRYSMPSEVENMIHHMKNFIHGNQKNSVEKMEGFNGNEMRQMLGAVNSKPNEAIYGRYFESGVSEDIFPSQIILPYEELDDDGYTRQHLHSLNNRIRVNEPPIELKINSSPYLEMYNKFGGNLHKQRQFTPSKPNHFSTTVDTTDDLFAESEHDDVRKERVLEDTDWETIFSSHFQPPDAPKRSTFRTSFKKVKPLNKKADHSLEVDEHASRPTASEISPTQKSPAVRVNVDSKIAKYYARKNNSNVPPFSHFDTSPWRPAYPLLMNNIKLESIPSMTTAPNTTDSIPSAVKIPNAQYGTDFNREDLKLKLKQKNILKGKKPIQNVHRKNNLASNLSAKLKQLIKPPKRKVTGLSWPKRLYNYVSTSFFGKDASDAKRNNTESSSDGYVKTSPNKRQKWPRTEASTSTDAPVVANKEYITVTAIAALGTLTSMVLFSLSNPFGGRDDSNTKVLPDPLVENTLELLAEAVAEYKNFTEESADKSHPLPMTTSEFKYPEHRISKDHVDQMLTSINAKHTVNIKNNLALFVSKAYRLLKKYPTDTGIIKLVNNALQFYKKLNSEWKYDANIENNKESRISDNDWRPLGESDLRNMIYLMHEMNEIQKLKESNESLSNIPQRQTVVHNNFSTHHFNSSNTETNFLRPEDSTIASSLTHFLTSEGLSQLKMKPFTNLLTTTNVTKPQTSQKTPISFSGELKSKADGRSEEEYRSRNEDRLLMYQERLLYPPVTSTGLQVSTLSQANFLKLTEADKPRKTAVIDNILQEYDRVFSGGAVDAHVGIIPPQIEKKSNPSESPAVQGIFINNELHVPSEQLLQSAVSR